MSRGLAMGGHQSAWQEGYGPDPEGWVLDQAASDLRHAIEGKQP